MNISNLYAAIIMEITSLNQCITEDTNSISCAIYAHKENHLRNLNNIATNYSVHQTLAKDNCSEYLC